MRRRRDTNLSMRLVDAPLENRWQPILEGELAARALDTVRAIGETLRTPREKTSPPWRTGSPVKLSCRHISPKQAWRAVVLKPRVRFWIWRS